MEQRSLKEVKALSVDDAVEIMRQAGIVGAGGGGFPTYFKYKSPQPHLIVNATESEPGYWGDKLLHKEHVEEFLQVFDALKTIFDFECSTMYFTSSLPSRVLMATSISPAAGTAKWASSSGGVLKQRKATDL